MTPQPKQRLGDTNAAASLVQQPPSTIRTWADRGILRHQGTDERGRALYDLAEVEALAKGEPVSPCLVTLSRAGDCKRPALLDAPIPLCRKHILEAYLFVADEIASTFHGDPDRPPLEIAGMHTPVVYFMRSGELIKIGTSSNLRTRLNTLQPEEYLGCVAGSYPEEKQAHHAWKHLRVRGEWFRATPELLDWIRSVVTDTTDPRTRNQQQATG